MRRLLLVALLVPACKRPVVDPAPTPPPSATAPGVGRAGDAAAGVPERDDAPPRGLEPSLSGMWEGTYDHDGVAGAPVTFQAELTIDAGRIDGSIVEPNTFGAASVSHLRANVSGTLTPDDQVGFVKTYDGTGGVFHSVEYTGHLQRDRLQIRGSWHIGDQQGRFSMRRVRRPAGLVHRGGKLSPRSRNQASASRASTVVAGSAASSSL